MASPPRSADSPYFDQVFLCFGEELDPVNDIDPILTNVEAPASSPYFDIVIDNNHYNLVPIPEEFQQHFPYPPRDEQWHVFNGLSSPDWNVVHPVLLQWYNYDGRRIYCISYGWTSFVRRNEIVLGDLLRIYILEKYRQIRVRTFRHGREVVTTTPSIEQGRHGKRVGFEVTFKKSYMDMKRMNVTLKFANRHFGGLNSGTAVDLRLGNKNWPAKLEIRRQGNKITACSVKHGVDRFYKDTNVKHGDKMWVDYDAKSNPRSFTLS